MSICGANLCVRLIVRCELIIVSTDAYPRQTAAHHLAKLRQTESQQRLIGVLNVVLCVPMTAASTPYHPIYVRTNALPMHAEEQPLHRGCFFALVTRPLISSKSERMPSIDSEVAAT